MASSSPTRLARQGKSIRDRLELIDGVEEGVGGVLVAQVNLHIGDAAIADVVVRAVQCIRRQLLLGAAGIAHRGRAATPMHLHDRVLPESVEAGGRIGLRIENDLNVGPAQRGKKRQHLLRAVLGAGHRIVSRQCPRQIRRRRSRCEWCPCRLG
jgi:hypothetical protein